MDEEKIKHTAAGVFLSILVSASVPTAAGFSRTALREGGGERERLKGKKKKKKSTIDMLQVNRSTVWLQGRGTY